MKRTFATLATMLMLTSCSYSQNKSKNEFRLAGGGCEGCEAVFEFGDKAFTATDTLPDFKTAANKIKLIGTVYLPDGKTPAKDVVLYIYHTNANGLYATKGDEKGWARRHGYLRGWVKTDSNGAYTFYTHKPGPYPNGSLPAHIHAIVLEPDGKYYWLEDYYFEGDTLLTEKEINPKSPRGGSSGLLRLQKENGMWLGKRDFIVGKNVAAYK